jgi:hypothetical protein
MGKPKVRLWDIETLPNVAVSFGVWDQNLRPESILKTTSICSISWKELGEKTVHNVSIGDFDGWKDNPYDDKKLVSVVRDVLLDADILIHHNGDKFDLKYFNTRLMANGFTALPKFQTIDTYKVAKSRFHLNSNKLSYLADILGVAGKDDMCLADWIGVLSGKTSSLRKMEAYNNQDVVVLEQVYNKIISYVPSHANHNVFTGEDACPACGSHKLIKRGYHLTKTSKKQRYVCKDCGSWSHSGKSDVNVDIRSS